MTSDFTVRAMQALLLGISGTLPRCTVIFRNAQPHSREPHSDGKGTLFMARQLNDELAFIEDISVDDTMFHGDASQYFSVGRSALACISVSLDAAALPAEHVRRILDLPCGHGRVLRHLRAAFPAAEITACDLQRDAVDYCATTFGATAVYSEEHPSKVPLDRDAFDLIWVGSLLTHLDSRSWRGFLELFHRTLRPGGVLVFSTHGRRAYDWLVRDAVDYGLRHARRAAVLFGYERTGFGYANYLGQSGYGLTLSRPDWVFRQIEQLREMRLVHFSEAAWSSHQDVYACVRDPEWQVHHRRTSRMAHLKRVIGEWVTRRG